MIDNLHIKNFKSIKELKFVPKKINVFIGEPNSEKSNILESLGLLSGLHYGLNNMGSFVRIGRMPNLFFDGNVKENISIEIDKRQTILVMEQNETRVVVRDDKRQSLQELHFRLEGQFSRTNLNRDLFANIKYYVFKRLNEFSSQNALFLDPPHGENLAALASSSSEIKQIMTNFFNEVGYDVLLDTFEKKISILKKTDGAFVSLPYAHASDSFQRIIFFLSAMKSNTNSTLVFEEPEANVFPYYVTLLAESIGLDSSSNQYFIATHNPYFVQSIIEKSPKDHLSIVVTYLEDSQTKIKVLSDQEIGELFEHDPFLNLHEFLGS